MFRTHGLSFFLTSALVMAASGQSSSSGTVSYYLQVNDAPFALDQAALANSMPNGTSIQTFSSGDADIFLATPSVCSAGYYCPAGNIPQACPLGTYNPYTQKSLQSECLPCPSGFYCGTGSSSPSSCPSGSFMSGGACAQCPQGSYCNSQSPTPQACQPGTFGAAPGLGSASDCTQCPAGSFCGGTGLTVATSCDAGYYSSSAGSSACLPCPPGSYCTVENRGTIAPIQCAAGFYNDVSGGFANSSCMTCTYGAFCCVGCVNPVLPTGCDKGYYCSVGAKSPTPCNVSSSQRAPNRLMI